jgi:putative membrane protein
MTTDNERRKPAAFRLDDPAVTVTASPDEKRSSSAGGVRVLTEEDAFAVPAPIQAKPAPRKGFRWGTLFWAALGGLVSLGIGLAVTRLIEDLFARAPGLGWVGAALAALAGLAFLVIVGRELFGLLRLARIEKLHARAAAVLLSDDRNEARAVVAELIRLAMENPRLARGRTVLTQHVDDIIDGADLVRLAERELMTPLDEEARRLISQAAQRVSVVTAVSPRAAIDMLFVLISALRLVRQLARLYGGRPGLLGLAKLFRQTVAHLAVTGSVAVGDGLLQQALGHGLASRVSAKLGEGVLNGFLTARLGLAALDVIRPLPFATLPRPALSDLIKDLTRSRDSAS